MATNLKTMPEVRNYLLSGGYSISERQLWTHKKEGKFSEQRDGTYRVVELDAYATRHLDCSIEGERPNDKTEAEIRRINADADMRELRYRQALGELIEASQVEIEMAKRAQGLKSYFESFSRGMAGQLIKICKGDKEQESVVRDFLLAAHKKAFDIYARGVIIDDDDA